jgi:hypothetical protein
VEHHRRELLLIARFAGAAAIAIAGCSSSSGADSTASEAPVEAGAPEGGGDDAGPPVPDAPQGLIVHPAEFTEESMPLRLLNDGDDLHLWKAPQGGHVVLVAAQVEHMTSDTATLKVRMRRPAGIVVAEESRTVAMVHVPDHPELMQPDIRSRSQVAHVPLCPDYDAEDIVDQPLDVDITVLALYTDPPLSGTTTYRLVPTCSAAVDPALCRCECQGGYVLGRCAADAASDE